MKEQEPKPERKFVIRWEAPIDVNGVRAMVVFAKEVTEIDSPLVQKFIDTLRVSKMRPTISEAFEDERTRTQQD